MFRKFSNTEVEFEPNRSEIVSGIFLPKKAVLAETNYGTFLFLLGPIHGQNKSEINSTSATDSRFRSISEIHSSKISDHQILHQDSVLPFVTFGPCLHF